ncbi:MAG: hypothetical protein OEZ51_09160 [Nitrospinota bacterium]|nr:hypothetical protein [Nitrospinota bacterium]
MKERNKKELAEFLWLEINRAIINSNNVRNCLKILKEMNMLDFLCQHDYILDGKKLVEKLLDEPYPADEIEERANDPLEAVLESENSSFSPDPNNKIDFSKGVFSKNLIRAYGFCRN